MVISSNDLLHVELAKTKVIQGLQRSQSPRGRRSMGYPHGQDLPPQPMHLEDEANARDGNFGSYVGPLICCSARLEFLNSALGFVRSDVYSWKCRLSHFCKSRMLLSLEYFPERGRTGLKASNLSFSSAYLHNNSCCLKDRSFLHVFTRHTRLSWQEGHI